MTILSTAAAGLERIDAGKAWQGAVFLLGATIGSVVFVIRRRRQQPSASEEKIGTGESAASTPLNPPELAEPIGSTGHPPGP